MNKSLKLSVLLLLLTALFVGCIDTDRLEEQFANIDLEGNISPSFVIPLVNSTLNVGSLLKRSDANTVLSERNDVLYLGFYDTVALSLDVLDFDMQYQERQQTFKIKIKKEDIPTSKVSGLIKRPVRVNLPFLDPRFGIKKLDLESGIFTYNYSFHIDNYTIPSVKELPSAQVSKMIFTSLKKKSDNQPKIDTLWGKNVDGPNITMDLSDYYLDLYDATNENANQFMVEFDIFVDSDSLDLHSATELNIDFTLFLKFMDLRASTIYGNTTDPYTMTPKIKGNAIKLPLDVFRYTQKAKVEFAEPRINFAFANNFGFPIGFGINKIVAENTQSKKKEEVKNSASIGENTLKIGSETWNVLTRATSPDDTIMHKDEFYLDRTNSNLANALAIGPDKFLLEPKLQIGDKSNNDYFISRNSKIELATAIELPLNVNVDVMIQLDTIEGPEFPDIQEYRDKYGVDSLNVALQIQTKNDLPVDLNLQAYFVDSLGVTIDSLFKSVSERFILRSAEVDNNGKVLKQGMGKQVISVDIDRYNRLRKTKNIVLQLTFNSWKKDGESRTVKIRTDHNLQIEMMTEIGIHI